MHVQVRLLLAYWYDYRVPDTRSMLEIYLLTALLLQLPKNPITASPSPVEPKLQQRSEPLPQGGERSFVPTGALTGDPQLQALLEKQKNKVIEGEPGENYKLLEESQKFKQSCSAAPAVTSELQQKLNKRRC